MDRREFLATTAAALALSGCESEQKKAQGFSLPEPTPEQRAKRRKDAQSTVGLIKCETYDVDIFARMKEHLDDLKLPDLKGKRVVLKPNMVEIQPGKPITTHPAVLAAAAKLVDYLGAKEIIVAEGPGHMRDTEMMMQKSGLGPMAKKLGLPFIDLNLDDIEPVKVSHTWTGLDKVYMPKTIVHADAVISIPKMKTHHWVGVTISMKNMFGTVPGRKYGWPKNILHVRGIPRWILDLQHIVNPTFAVVDAIIAMEGDGPINGEPKHTGFVAVGTDLAAVDATCCRTMEISIDEIPYIKMAGQVVGNVEEHAIKIVGVPIASVKQQFDRPITLKDKAMLVNADHQGS